MNTGSEDARLLSGKMREMGISVRRLITRPTVPCSSSYCTIRMTDWAKLGSANFSFATRMSPTETCDADLTPAACHMPLLAGVAATENTAARTRRAVSLPHIATILPQMEYGSVTVVQPTFEPRSATDKIQKTCGGSRDDH